MSKWGRQEFSESHSLSEHRQVRPNQLDAALDGICSIVAGLTSATTVLVGQRNIEKRCIQVKGRYGTLVKEVDMTFVLPSLNAETHPTLAIQNLRTDPRFSNHPLLQLMPYTRSLIAMLIPGCELNERAVLKIINPRRSAFTDPTLWNELAQFCEVISNLLCIKQAETQIAESVAAVSPHVIALAKSTDDSSSSEQKPLNNAQTNLPSVSFLFDTLVKKRVLHARNGVDFITMRTWRGPLKDYQISALVSLKRNKAPELVQRVAAELAAATQNLHGQGNINCVVPVPGGNSGDDPSFSVLVAQEVALLLNIPFADLLTTANNTSKPGKSSPHKSAKLMPYTLARFVAGPILVVDDVVSSGKHMELAISSLRTQAKAVYGIAWIGK